MLRHGIDGPVLAGTLPPDPCCPEPVCAIDDCSFVCNFVQAALPDGPLWDQAKRDFNASRMPDCTAAPGQPFCSDLVAHASFVAKFTLYHIRNAIWPAVREASPFTAWTTRQYWLDRWGWSNCFLDPNRPDILGALTPYEVATPHTCEEFEEQGAIGIVPTPDKQRVLAPPAIPQPLQDAVTRGTIKALARRSLGPIPNLASLNFIIAPLGAQVSVAEPFDVWAAIKRRSASSCQVVSVTGSTSQGPTALDIEPWEEQGTGSGFDPVRGPFGSLCRGAATGAVVNADDEQGQGKSSCCIYDVPLCLTITPKDTIRGDLIAECPRVTPTNVFDADIQSYIEPCDPARPPRIYPGALAAECIVRSILPDTMPYTLSRCPEPTAPSIPDPSRNPITGTAYCIATPVCGMPYKTVEEVVHVGASS